MTLEGKCGGDTLDGILLAGEDFLVNDGLFRRVPHCQRG